MILDTRFSTCSRLYVAIVFVFLAFPVTNTFASNASKNTKNMELEEGMLNGERSTKSDSARSDSEKSNNTLVLHRDYQFYTTPGAEGVELSSIYQVSLQGNPLTIFQSSPPEKRYCSQERCDGGDSVRKQKRTLAWTQFSFGEPVTVTIKKPLPDGKVRDIEVRPSRTAGVDYEIIHKDVNSAQITLRIIRPNSKLSIEFMDDRYDTLRELPLDGLLIFADQFEQLDRFPPPEKHLKSTYLVSPHESFDLDKAARAQAVYFLPGVHEMGYWEVPKSVMHVYLEGGAYVKGAINSAVPAKRLQKGFKVTGRGILSGEVFPWRASKRKQGREPCLDERGEAASCWYDFVKLLQFGTDQFHLEGITLVNPPTYIISGFNDSDFSSSEHASDASNDKLHDASEKDTHKNHTKQARFSGHMHNFKVLGSWRWNADGVAVLKNTSVSECFVSAFDDAFKLYSDGSRVEDCVVWHGDNGAVFQLGWYAKDVTNVQVNNIDIIHAEWTGRNQNWGVFNFANREVNKRKKTSEKLIRDVTFSNIFVEGPATRVFGFENYMIQHQSFVDLTFKNIIVERMYDQEEERKASELGNGAISLDTKDAFGYSLARPHNIISDTGKTGRIENIVIENLQINGKKITSENTKAGAKFILLNSEDQVDFR